VGEKDAGAAERLLKRMEETSYPVGRVIKARRGGPRVEYR